MQQIVKAILDLDHFAERPIRIVGELPNELPGCRRAVVSIQGQQQSLSSGVGNAIKRHAAGSGQRACSLRRCLRLYHRKLKMRQTAIAYGRYQTP